MLSCLGCCNGQPAGPAAPPFDPAASGRRAIADYDIDDDGMISSDEAQACPSLAAAFQRVDTNSDGALSEDEIVSRVSHLLNAPVRIVSGSAHVTLDGQPLIGATVTLEPEPFMGDAFKTLSAVTDERGDASLSGHSKDFPGIYLGFYRVRVSKQVEGKELLAPKYNRESVLGYEAADDTEETAMNINFDLSSESD